MNLPGGKDNSGYIFHKNNIKILLLQWNAYRSLSTPL